ncbi:RNA-directed DNA polymerase from mobile element jockey [Elysia marginata]|uniref:RNA-directed DNA polymerase from mobile element jockey n=1 Tax=Elysia marginata TaxID=1093978 RepID=A0AAV4HAQ9_9GAST|nr:RNA-directed DNA polymerase from mobile element jockey [Elysia marginata]
MFKRMKNILTNPHMSIKTRKRVLECYIEPMLMYGCESWIISKQTRGRLEATEIWFLRRMVRIPWTAKKPNDTVLSEIKTKRALINKIRKRQAICFGHIMRRERQEHLVTKCLWGGVVKEDYMRKRLTGWRLGLSGLYCRNDQNDKRA